MDVVHLGQLLSHTMLATTSHNSFILLLTQSMPAYPDIIQRPTPVPPPPRRSPSPGPSRRYIPHEDYGAPRSAPAYRDGYSNYGQNSYRPDSHTYFSRSPSPDRRHEPARDLDTDHWDRPMPWQSPNKPAAWPDRRATLSPASSARSRDRVRSDPIAPRMFEPSDAWKQTQVDRSNPLPRYSIVSFFNH